MSFYVLERDGSKIIPKMYKIHGTRMTQSGKTMFLYWDDEWVWLYADGYIPKSSLMLPIQLVKCWLADIETFIKVRFLEIKCKICKCCKSNLCDACKGR